MKKINMKDFSLSNKLLNEDYYLSNEGYVIFTKKFHLKRGFCCKSNCINCPYIKTNKKNEQI